jgi:hypothetical protein
MKISGIVQFEGMSAAGINLVREFQRCHPAVGITFAANLSTAIAEWESFNNLAHLTRLAAAVQVSDTKSAHSNDSVRQTA